MLKAADFFQSPFAFIHLFSTILNDSTFTFSDEISSIQKAAWIGPFEPKVLNLELRLNYLTFDKCLLGSHTYKEKVHFGIVGSYQLTYNAPHFKTDSIFIWYVIERNS